MPCSLHPGRERGCPCVTGQSLPPISQVRQLRLNEAETRAPHEILNLSLVSSGSQGPLTLELVRPQWLLQQDVCGSHLLRDFSACSAFMKHPDAWAASRQMEGSAAWLNCPTPHSGSFGSDLAECCLWASYSAGSRPQTYWHRLWGFI